MPDVSAGIVAMLLHREAINRFVLAALDVKHSDGIRWHRPAG